MSISRKKSTISSKALAALFQRGVGSGLGKTYQPLHTTENMDAIGRSGKYACPLTGRTRHFMSDGEERLIYGALRDLEVEDARENYPLAIGLTRQIAQAMDIKHSSSTGVGKPLIPYSTDLLVTRRVAPRYVALSARTRAALKGPEDNNSLLIEHAYWTLHEVPFFRRY